MFKLKDLMMKILPPATLMLALSLGAATPAFADAQMACKAVTNAEIEGQFATFNAAWATKDPDKVTALFTKDAVLLPTVSNTPRTTPAGVRDYFVSFLKGSPQAVIQTSTIKKDCNTVSRVGLWTVTLTNAATGVKSDVKARYSFTYKWDAGSWKIDHLHSSMLPET